MGAGKGKNRRVSTTTAAKPLNKVVTSVTENRSNLQNWLRSEGIQNVGVLDYYLVQRKSDAVSDKEKDFLLKELFLDAVNADALMINGGNVDPNDFYFTVKKDGQGSSYYSYLDVSVEYRPRGAAVKGRGNARMSSYYLEGNRKLSSMKEVLYYLRAAVQNAAE